MKTDDKRIPGAVVLPPHFRFNFTALMVDYVAFSVGFSIISVSTVLPAFVRTLTDSQPLIGLVGTLFSAGWFLPQLGAAALMSGKPRKKPFMLVAVYLERPIFLLVAVALWAGLASRPSAMLAVFFTAVALFTILDGIASVAWFDILARTIPLARRGRLVGGSQLISGLLGIGVGLLVGHILESPALPYPHNYALLFALSSVVHFPSLIALTLLREPQKAAGESHASLAEFTRKLGQVWRGEPDFRRLLGFRWLVGLMGLATPFYILHATEVVGLPEAATGWFVSATMAGGVVASLWLGWLSERKGPRPVIWATGLTALLMPLLALLIHFVPLPGLEQAYVLIYFLYGMNNNLWMLGPTNYVLEMASEEQRVLYVGLYNTLGLVLVPSSVLGGFLLQATSYPALFACTTLGVAAGLLLSLGLREPQRTGR